MSRSYSSGLTRREFARAVLITLGTIACRAPTGTPSITPTRVPATPTASPATPAASPGVLIRAGAFADGRDASPRRGVSLLIRAGRVAYLGPRDGEPDPAGAELVDVPGATI